MQPTSKKGGANKKRLGRGLGSLLSTDASDFADSPQPVPAKQKKILQQEKVSNQTPSPSLATPKTTQVASPVPQKTSSNNTLSDVSRVWSLAIEKIVPNQTQPRKDFHKESLAELAASIKEQGVLQPITVRKLHNNYEIIAGERRWRASQLAGLKEVPVLVRNVNDQKSMELALIENLQREDLNTVEEAMGYQLLIDDYDLSQEELAKKVGKSRSSVTNALRVLTLPRDVRQMLRQGLLTLGHAKVLLGLQDPKQQVGLARKAIQKRLSVRALEKEIKNTGRPQREDLGGLNVSQKLAQGLANDLQKTLGTKVNIQYRKGKGRVEIAFYSDDELSSLCEKIKNSWHK